MSLLEAVLVVGLFAILSAALFGMFHWGVSQFFLGASRQSAQSQAARALAVLEKTIREAPRDSVGLATGPGRQVTVAPNTFSRDGVVVASLSNWSDASLYDVDGVPRWDRYVMFYATNTVPTGELRRVLINPTNPVVGPWILFPGGYLATPPLPPGGVIEQSTLLADDLLHFKISPAASGYRIELIFQARSSTGKEEFLQTNLLVTPRNNDT
ncbi:MAG: type II secretion system protein J [Vulcanimicrobiota bacterium]